MFFSVLFYELIRLICSINASLLYCGNIDIAHWHFSTRQNLCLFHHALFVMVEISLGVHEHRYVVAFFALRRLDNVLIVTKLEKRFF